MNRQQKISIIVPVLNEAKGIEVFLQKLQILRTQGHEVILVDGQSSDDTCLIAYPLVDTLLSSPPGRAKQQRLGANNASGEIFLFLHADTQLPAQAEQQIIQSVQKGSGWGRFNVHLSGSQYLFRVIEKMMNWRSCITGICTGDQAIFVSKTLYNAVAGIPDIALMEDIEFSKQLLKHDKPVCIKFPVTTSSRRWENKGIIKTVFFMWYLRLCYFFWVKPEKLYKKYY